MIEINTTDEYKLTGDVRVTSGMVNASYTLPELLKRSEVILVIPESK